MKKLFTISILLLFICCASTKCMNKVQAAPAEPVVPTEQVEESAPAEPVVPTEGQDKKEEAPNK